MIRLICIGSGAVIAALFFVISFYLLFHGYEGLYLSYLFDNPQNLGKEGGIGPILFNTLLIVGLAVLLAIPFSLMTAITYTQMVKHYHCWLQKIFLNVIDVGIGIPRVVYGLAGATLVGSLLDFGISITTGIITMACLLSPILTTGFISGIENVDASLVKQGQALGLSRFTVFWRLLIPAAKPAIIATIVLSISRGLADAAALLFTAGIAGTLTISVFDSAATLSVWIFQLVTAIPGGEHQANTAALILFLLTLLVQLIASFIDQRRL